MSEVEPINTEIISETPASQSGERQVFYQALADNLSALIAQKNLGSELPASIDQNVEPAVEHTTRNRIIWATIGSVAAGGGIYLETAGHYVIGSGILGFEATLLASPVHERVGAFIDRMRNR